MSNLESFRDNLTKNIEDSISLIQTANTIISQSSLPVRLTIEQRDFIVEWALVKVHAAWESFLESCFIAYMLGEQTSSGFTPLRYVFPNDEQHALNLILAGREYFPWTSPSAVRRQSTLCFQNGQPFSAIVNSMVELQEINTLRNAIVHGSRVAVEKFKTLVRDKILTVPPSINPSTFLLTSQSRQKTYFTYYCNKLSTIADKIVPS